MRSIAILLLLAMLAAPGVAGAGGCSAIGLGRIVQSLGRETNETRGAEGRPQLRIDPQLSVAAQRHACDLAGRQVVSHQNRQGHPPMTRVKAAGFPACFSAENIAQGTPSPGVTVSAWQNSAGHARNQQHPRAEAMGFGVARGANGQLYWVGLYAARCRMGLVSRAPGRLRPFRW